ncbi:acyltransferase family protein [Hyphomonas pacifica]|uniref:acyltransferase family protein n=1 Tax=Hyphomonas pacifica TaxID=1280941 RepID=UPI001F4767F4|nr:acyltransferase [Hyphomonas pacifica]
MATCGDQTVPNDPLFGANHLTAVRWGLAGLVALGHIFLLTDGYEPIRLHQWTGGYMAVNGFFILSGLLIAKSLSTRRNLGTYLRSRLLRIYPALIAMALAFILVFAPFFSEPGGIERIWSAETWRYALRVLAMGDPEHAPGGIFAGNLEADFNGPLWTIRFEMLAYLAAAFGFFTGLLGGFKRVIAAYLIVQLSYLVLPNVVDFATLSAGALSLLRLSSAFLMGMVLWHWPAARRPHSLIVASLAALFVLFGAGPVGELLANLALIALLLRLGLPNRQNATVSAIPDYSYGIYIWHYPVMQGVLFLQPSISPVMLAIISIPGFILLSALSWHLIEKPALRLKKRRRPKAVLVFDREGAQ